MISRIEQRWQLANIPSKWDIVRLGMLAKIYAGGTPDKSNLDYWTNGAIPWINSGAVNDRLICEPSAFISEEGFKNSSARWVPEGSLVMALAGQGKTKGTVAQLGISTTCNQSMAAILPKGIVPRYLYHWLDSNYRNIRGLAADDLRDGLNLEMLRSIPCPLPSESDQKEIAAFLDQETAKADALVIKYERLIELLEESRKVIVANAVTKGLDPNVAMKDSGLEWVGLIPAHWDIRRVKYLFRLVTERSPNDHGLELLSLYTGIGVRPRKELEERGNRATDIDGYWLVKKGDIVVNKLLAWMGAIAISDYDGVTSPAYDILRAKADINPSYYDLLFRCGIYLGEFRNRSRGIMDMRLRLYFDQLGSVRVPVPPRQEQNKIVAELTKRCKAIDESIQKVQRGIDLLRERRSALITAAVTGQIDIKMYGAKEMEFA